MRALLRADLRALGNLARRREGRAVLAANVLTIGCTALGSVVVAHRVLLPRSVLEVLREDATGEVARFLLGLVGGLCAVLALSIAMHDARRRLFEEPVADLLLASPVSRTAIVANVFLRTLASAVLYGSGIGIPAAALVLDGANAEPAAALVAFPVAAAILAAPILAGVILFQVAALRWFAGRRTKRLLETLVALSAMAFALLAGVGLLGGGADAVTGWVGERAALPGWIEGPTALAALVAGVPGGRGLILPGLLPLAAVLPALALAGRMYGRAFENARIAADPLGRRRLRPRWWPSSVSASVAWRDFVHLAQSPGVWLGYLFVPALLLIFAKGGPLEMRAPRPEVPPYVPELFRAFNLWYPVLFMHALFTTMGLLGETRAQLSLLAASPASRAGLLRGRIFFILQPLAWCSLSAFGVAALAWGTSVATLGLFLAVLFPFVALAVGLIAAVGTIPAFGRPAGEVPTSSSPRVVLPILLVTAGLAPGWLFALKGLVALRRAYEGRGPLEGLPEWAAGLFLLGAAWVAGLLAGRIGWKIGVRNVRALLDPEP